MADQTAPLTYGQLIDELRRACVDKRTGTMMIATQENQLARILFEDGEIVSIACGLKRGRDAIPLLQEIKQARVKFSRGKIGSHSGALPPTAEIMRMLSGETAAPAAATTTAPATAGLTADQVPKALKVIETELIEFLGPLANIVWAEHLERIGTPVGVRKLHGLVDGLAKEIGDPTKIQRFKEQVWQKIGAIRNAPR